MLHFCTYEDRPANRVGLKLLILSFNQYASESILTVFLPADDPALESWANELTTRVRFRVLNTCSTGWAVKPDALLSLLDNGGEGDSAVWIDADVLALAGFESFFRGLSGEIVATAQDFYQAFNPASGHAIVWGWQVTRHLGCAVNSSVVRVTQKHRELLLAWQQCLRSDLFKREQKKGHFERKPEVYGDQNVLEGLLSSDAPGGFDRIPFNWLRTGRDMIHEHHYYSYNAKHRLLNAAHLGRPIFLHCQCARPWMYLERMDPDALATMAYVRAASQWRSELDEDVEAWMDLSTPLSRWARRLTFNNIHAQGLALWVRDRWRRMGGGRSNT